MKLTSFSVRNHQFTILVFLCLAAVGFNAFRNIPRSEDPKLLIPASSVIVVCPGANAVEMERLVARPIEDAVKELDDLHKLRTSVEDGVALVEVEFYYGNDPDTKYNDVLRQVNAVRGSLPANTSTVEVRRWQTNNVATLQLALVSPDASYGRLQDLAELLRERLETEPGVRDVQKWAYPEKQVRVSLDLAKLAQLHLPLAQVIGALQGGNTNIPGGAVESGARRFNLKTTGAYADLDEVRQTPLGAQGAAVVRLGDVAEVEWTTEELEQFGRFNGERAVFVTVRQLNDQNVLALRDRVRARIEAFRAELPGDVRLELAFDQADNVARRLRGLEHDFLIAIGLVLITILPLGVRASLLVALSIPLSLAMGVSLLYFTGHGLNQLTIVGMVIALGLLVDDSIVVAENIARFRRLGHPPVEAAIAATEQIAIAVIGTTATVLFAFLPLAMMPGDSGQFIRGLPLSVMYTVTASMFVALTIIPFLASRMLRGREEAEGNFILRGLMRGIHATYRPLLHRCMQHRLTTLVVAAVLLGASFLLVPQIGFSLFPKAGLPQFLVKIRATESTNVGASDALARRVESVLARTPEIVWYFTTVGKGNPQVYYNEAAEQQKASFAEVFASLREFDPDRSPALLDRLRAEFDRIPGAQIQLKEFENGPPIAAPIAVRVLGPELEGLRAAGVRLEELLTGIEGTENIDNPLRTSRTDLRLRLNRPAAALAGVSEFELDRAVRLAFAGLNVTRFREADGDEYNLQLALPRADRASLDNWRHILVPTASGAYVPIGQVATLEFESAPPVIQRFNRERSVTVKAWVKNGYNTDRLTAEVVRRLEAQPLPAGYRWELGGQAESRAETFGGFGTAVLVALFGVLAVIVLEFRSFRGTAIVASVIPLGVIGGLVGLWLTGYTLSFTATIGFIALIGIEIKNSILLVDFTNQLREKGVPLKEAIERAGETRFLPVVLTTCTAVGALMPLALQRSELFSPLAIVILGGLISSLLLSRLVTPVMYSLIPPPGPETAQSGTAAGTPAAPRGA
ncbi:MAG TPA: efflux RND transporter permease subunit [Opitutaceae bacterium]|nr:efflux RND transporter permease subunit [Opitutaceae bacterium]